jgi:hypothetical protein
VTLPAAWSSVMARLENKLPAGARGGAIGGVKPVTSFSSRTPPYCKVSGPRGFQYTQHSSQLGTRCHNPCDRLALDDFLACPVWQVLVLSRPPKAALSHSSRSAPSRERTKWLLCIGHR